MKNHIADLLFILIKLNTTFRELLMIEINLNELITPNHFVYLKYNLLQNVNELLTDFSYMYVGQ